MAAAVKLQDLIDAMSMQFDDAAHWLDRETGEVWFISGEQLRDAEGEEEDDEPLEELPEGELDEYAVARLIACGDRFLKLPTQWEIHEWEILREFSEAQEKPAVREALLTAISGRGAFRYFKDTAHRLGLWDQWNEFRENALCEIAIEWCEEHDIPFVDDRRRARRHGEGESLE